MSDDDHDNELAAASALLNVARPEHSSTEKVWVYWTKLKYQFDTKYGLTIKTVLNAAHYDHEANMRDFFSFSDWKRYFGASFSLTTWINLINEKMKHDHYPFCRLWYCNTCAALCYTLDADAPARYQRCQECSAHPAEACQICHRSVDPTLENNLGACSVCHQQAAVQHLERGLPCLGPRGVCAACSVHSFCRAPITKAQPDGIQCCQKMSLAWCVACVSQLCVSWCPKHLLRRATLPAYLAPPFGVDTSVAASQAPLLCVKHNQTAYTRCRDISCPSYRSHIKGWYPSILPGCPSCTHAAAHVPATFTRAFINERGVKYDAVYLEYQARNEQYRKIIEARQKKNKKRNSTTKEIPQQKKRKSTAQTSSSSSKSTAQEESSSKPTAQAEPSSKPTAQEEPTQPSSSSSSKPTEPSSSSSSKPTEPSSSSNLTAQAEPPQKATDADATADKEEEIMAEIHRLRQQAKELKQQKEQLEKTLEKAESRLRKARQELVAVISQDSSLSQDSDL